MFLRRLSLVLAHPERQRRNLKNRKTMKKDEMISTVENIYLELKVRLAGCTEIEDTPLRMKIEKAVTECLALHQALIEVKVFTSPWVE